MDLKSILFVSILIAAIAAAPIAEAQLGLISNFLRLIRIQGTPDNGNIVVNGKATAVFPSKCSGAIAVQWKCCLTATINSSGIFSILLDPLQFVLSSLLANCGLMVNMPLASCNAKLPGVGGLVSSLQFIGNTFRTAERLQHHSFRIQIPA